MSNQISSPVAISPRLEKFFAKVAPVRPRLIFALDATYSRQDTWDTAAALTGQMFAAAATIGTLDVQLVYFRGWRECNASRWLTDARSLTSIMSGIHCKAGHTQIRKVLDHARKEHAKQKVDALVFIGDACEETPTDLYEATCPVPVFAFQEGDNPEVAKIFATIAKLTGGAHCTFDTGAAERLADLLKAVVAYATGGLKALSNQNSDAARLLLTQIRK